MNTTGIFQDSLKELLLQRITHLRRTHGESAYAERQSSRDILHAEISRMVQQEIKAGLFDLFGNPPRSGREGRDPFGDGDILMGRNASLMPRRSPSQSPEGCFPNDKQTRITIDQMIAETLMNGPQTSNVLRILFGLVPMLIGR